MELARALRLTSTNSVAFVGAGGKTTAMFQAARSQPTALVTATTHLAQDQLRLADFHFEMDSHRDAPDFGDHVPPGVILFTGKKAEHDRVHGVDALPLNWIHSLAESRSLPLLIEADGSRMRPIKAPAAHEPEIPAFVTKVVVVAGLSALGKPLTPEFVHRPEIFAQLTSLPLGALITPEALMRALTHPAGGLKGIPAGAGRVALLNQADSPELQAQGGGMADGLLSAYRAVVIAQLSGDGALTVRERVAGIVLAAGASSRMGQAKQVLDWQGQPLVRHAALTALAAGLEPVIVVTGAHADQVRAALAGLAVQVVWNEDWQAGQSASVKYGLAATPGDSGAAMFLLADQPFLTPPLIRALVEAHTRSLSSIVAPLIDEQRGNPVLFDRRTFPDFAELSGDAGARALFAKHRAEWVPWHDARTLLDVDTAEDYEALRASH